MPPLKPTVIHCYPSFHKLGGVERYLWELSRAQQPSRAVQVLTAHVQDPLPAEIKLKILTSPRRPSFLSTLVFSLLSTAYLLRRRPLDVIVHVQGANCLTGDVVTAHSCHKAWFIHSLRELSAFSSAFWKKLFNPMHWITIAIETWQYRTSSQSQIVAISQSIATELHRYYRLPATRITVIYNGVNVGEFDKASNAQRGAQLRQKLGFNSEQIVLLFAANEFRRKGLTAVLKAIQLLGQSHLRLVVAGRSDSKPFKTEAQRLGIAEQVTFIGPCSDMPALYAAADIFVFPTQYEPFGLVITEAMAAKLPVIVSRLAGASELMQHGIDALLIDNPQDPHELAEQIKKLFDSNARQRIATAGCQLVQSYTWQNMAARYDELYARIRKA